MWRKSSKYFVRLLSLLLLFVLPLSGCGTEGTIEEEHTVGVFAMGTYMTLTAYGESAEAALTLSKDRIKELEYRYSRKSFICLHTPFSSGNRSKLFFKECATRSTSPAMLQGEGAVWNLLKFLSDNFGFSFFHGVPFGFSTCDGQAIFTSHSIM